MDDSLQISGGIDVGWEYCENRNVLIHKNVGKYDEIPLDQWTFPILRDVANSIDPSIVMEFDVPSLHENGRLPVLDFEVWIE